MAYRKQLLVFDAAKPKPAVIRPYGPADFAALVGIQRECFPPPFPEEALWSRDQLSTHLELFPEGALTIEVEGRVCGSITGMLCHYDLDGPDHAWGPLTDWGYIRTHDPTGDTLYIVDISVRPAARSLGLGRQLMLAMYEVVVHRRLARLLGGGRMPGYHRHADRMSPQAYLDAVVRGDLADPVITFLLRCGRLPVRVVPDYLDDAESGNCAALMEWRNPFLPQMPRGSSHR